MIILHNSIFGYIKIIVFQLALWIGSIKLVRENCYEWLIDMLAFSYPVIPTRHEVSLKPTG